MRFTIVGAGALGTITAAHLIAAGHDVTVVARGQRAKQIAAHGLRVTGVSELALPCEPQPKLDPGTDPGVLVYAVKTYQMEAALATAAGVTPAAVFSMANGVMKNDQLRAAFTPASVVGCMANFSGELLEGGEVTFTRNVCLHLGGELPEVGAMVTAIHDAGINAALADDIESVEWSKYVGWIALFALAVISRAGTGRFLSNAYLAGVAARMIREAAAIADARGIVLVDQSPMPVKSIATLPFDAAVAAVREVGAEFQRSAPGHRMSSLQDTEAGRVLEVHETLGFAVQEAARLGLAAPALGELYALVAGLNELPR